MFLKRIAVSGFKSFCDPVEFDFGPGITCIVGPNGCGKSNVVDAVKWVLGEQSARSLRGRQMQDMIFNGSSTRKASGVAQVDLVFDNSDSSLALDHSEVTVTRKLYRSGESEYQLNREPVRLKDVRELFLDTGVGLDAYSVIEQGKVDVLLQSSPLDRRTIFEEAAGISKYKARKREAQRKLERTAQNLLRVSDVIDELEKRLRSVKLQAAKARRYQEHQARLNELRSNFALAEYARLSQDAARLEHDLEGQRDAASGLRAQIDRHEAEGSRATLQLDEFAVRIADTDNRLVQARAELAGQEERIESAGRRAQEQEQLLARAEARVVADTARCDQTRTELERVETQGRTLEANLTSLQDEIASLAERDRTLARELTVAQATLEDEKSGIIELLRRSAQTHNEIVRLNTRRESLVGQKGRLTLRDAQIAAELEGQLEHKAQLERRVEEVNALIRAGTERLEERKLEAARLGSLRQRLLDELALAKERRSALRSRREVLEDLERSMAGVGAGVRRLLEESRRSADLTDWQWVVGLVADVFEADVVHSSVVEAALGERAAHAVVRSRQALLDHFGNDELPGRLTALCLDRLGPVVNARDFSGQDGFVSAALDLVTHADEFTHLAHFLLGKTVVVEDLSAAVRLAALDTAGHRFVTRRGELLEPDGRVSLGPPSSAGTGLISRKSELRDIDVQLVELDRLLTTLGDQLERTETQILHEDGVQQELRSAIYDSSTARVEATTTLHGLAAAVDRLTREKPLVSQEVSILEQQINEVLRLGEDGGKSLKALERENERRETLVAGHQERIDRIVASRQEAQEQLTSLKVEVGQLREKRAAGEQRLESLRQALQELQTSAAAARAEIEQCRQQAAEAREAVARARDRVGRLTLEVSDHEGQAGQLRQQRDALRQELEVRNQEIKSARTQLETLEGQLHGTQMRLTEVSVRRDELVARVQGDLGVDLRQRYATYTSTGESDWEAVEREIAELRGKIERLGNVNLDAIDELNELEQRHGFLTTQRDDLREASRQLEKLIDRLNAESQERFQTAFEQIRGHFRGMFRKLFGGGRADIVLEDPQNVLECGIEIVAQPPGKDLQVISLMSGGEKSLTAVALLMSIFKTRPAPFAIMDEVDAALDEANNDRFNAILHEFVADTQFIVITHSKWTMNTAARLYGVTMQEPGISTRVGVELTGVHVA